MILREIFGEGGESCIYQRRTNVPKLPITRNADCPGRARAPQVVTLAVYTYFAAALMGAQWVQPLSAEDYVTITKLPSFSDDSYNGTARDGGGGRSYQG